MLLLLSKQNSIPKQEDGLGVKGMAFFLFCIYDNFINSGNATHLSSYMYTLMSRVVWKQIKQAVFFKQPLHITISVYLLDNMIVLKAYSQCNFPKHVRKEILFYTTTRTPSIYVDKQQDWIKKNENHRTITVNNKSRGAENPKKPSHIRPSKATTGQTQTQQSLSYAMGWWGFFLFCF